MGENGGIGERKVLLAAAADVSPCEAGDFATGSRPGYKITLIKDLPILTSGVSAVRGQHLGLVRIGDVIQIICPRREQLAGLLASSIGQGTIDAIESGGSQLVSVTLQQLEGLIGAQVERCKPVFGAAQRLQRRVLTEVELDDFVLLAIEFL